MMPDAEVSSHRVDITPECLEGGHMLNGLYGRHL